MIGWTQAERDLLAKAVAFTRRSYFTDAERLKLVIMIGRLSPTIDRTMATYYLLPDAVRRANPKVAK